MGETTGGGVRTGSNTMKYSRWNSDKGKGEGGFYMDGWMDGYMRD